MKKPQWITLAAAIVLVTILYVFGRTVPGKRPSPVDQSALSESTVSIDSILEEAKKRLSSSQVARLNSIEHSVVRGDVKSQQLKVYHQLALFWADSAGIFEPYAWFEAQAARLENSEKSLNFAAHLFLQNLRSEADPSLRSWKALQAKDLFERSLKLDPGNDSSIVGLGACYIFGNISATPMEGIIKVRSVADKDSTDIFAQEVLGQGSMLSGQYDKAIARFETVYRLSGNNVDSKLEACLMLAEAYEKKNESPLAVDWYRKSLSLVRNQEISAEIKKRISELTK